MIKEFKYNKFRHKLLKELYKKYPKAEVENNTKRTVDLIEAGLLFSEIDVFLKDSKLDRQLLLSELYKSKEIIFSNSPKFGVFIEMNNGVSSLVNKKYKKKNYKIITNLLRDVVQIIIPILALIIAIISLTIKFGTISLENNKSIEQVEQKIENIDKRIDKIELNNNKKKKDKTNLEITKDDL